MQIWTAKCGFNYSYFDINSYSYLVHMKLLKGRSKKNKLFAYKFYLAVHCFHARDQLSTCNTYGKYLQKIILAVLTPKSDIVVLLLDQYQKLDFYLNVLQLTYNVFWKSDKLVNNQLYNHLLVQLQFFQCYHIFLYDFLIVEQKRSVHHNIIIFYFCFWWNIMSCVYVSLLKRYNKKSVYSLKFWIS